VTEAEYRRAIAREQELARRHVRRQLAEFRHRMLGPRPDSIDRERMERLRAAVADFAKRMDEVNRTLRDQAAKLSTLRPIQLGPTWEQHMAQWRLKERIAMSVRPPTPAPVVTSMSLA
jgi:hypothetical protein